MQCLCELLLPKVFVADPLLEMYRKPASVEHRAGRLRNRLDMEGRALLFIRRSLRLGCFVL